MGSVTIACGPLYGVLGGEAYAVMAGLAAVGTVAAMMLRRGWSGGLVVRSQPQSAGGGGKTSPSL